MADLALALLLLVVVVVPLIGWAVRKDRRRRAAEPALREKEVA